MITTYRKHPPRRPIRDDRPTWGVLGAVVIALLVCAAITGARAWTIERLEGDIARLTATNAALTEQVTKLDSEADGWEQRALDAESEASVVRDDLEALRESIATTGGAR